MYFLSDEKKPEKLFSFFPDSGAAEGRRWRVAGGDDPQKDRERRPPAGVEDRLRGARRGGYGP